MEAVISNPQRVRVSLNRPQFNAFKLVRPGVLLTLVFGRGVGKSYTQRRIWYKLISEWEHRERPGRRGLFGVRIILLCPTFKNATDTYANALLNELATAFAFLGGVVNRSKWRVDFPGGSWIQFFGAENMDAARGMRCDVVSADECDDIDESSFAAVANPWLSEPWSLRIRILSGTPRRGRFGLLYHSYALGFELDSDGNKKHQNCFGLHATYRDAPRQVDVKAVEELRLTTDPQLFAREWEASFDSGDALVYPFRYDQHVRPIASRAGWSEIIGGMDWGWADPAALVVCGVRGQGRDATVHVFREVYKSQQPLSWLVQQAKALQSSFPTMRWWADPSQPANIDVMRSAGIRVEAADNDIPSGVTAVADRLFPRVNADGSVLPRLFVDPSCTNTIKEFSNYRRKRDPRDKDHVLDKIEDRYNHAMDALRYAIFNRFGTPPATKTVSGASW